MFRHIFCESLFSEHNTTLLAWNKYSTTTTRAISVIQIAQRTYSNATTLGFNLLALPVSSDP